MNEIEAKLRIIIRKIIDNAVDIDIVGSEHNLREFGLSSVDFIKLVVGIETEFGIEFDDDNLEITNYESLIQLMQFIETKLPQN